MHCLQNSLRSLPLGSGARKEETVSMLPLLLEANIDLTINEEGAAAASTVREEETQVVEKDKHQSYSLDWMAAPSSGAPKCGQKMALKRATTTLETN